MAVLMATLPSRKSTNLVTQTAGLQMLFIACEHAKMVKDSAEMLADFRNNMYCKSCSRDFELAFFHAVYFILK